MTATCKFEFTAPTERKIIAQGESPGFFMRANSKALKGRHVTYCRNGTPYMHVITNDEARQWCESHGLAMGRPSWFDPRIQCGIRFLTEGKQSIVEALVRNTVNNRRFDEAIVWILDWPLYREDEMAVVNRFRSSVGETRWLIDAPAHLFDANEMHDCIGLFNLCVQFFWDALLYIPASGLLAYNSHDGLQYVSSLAEADRNQLKAEIQAYDLTILR